MWSQDKSLEQVGLTDFELFLLKFYLIKLGPILPDQIFQVVERLKAVKEEATKRMNRKEN